MSFLYGFLTRLWRDESGFVVSTELVMVLTVLVIGLLAGMTAMRDSMIGEMSGISNAMSRMNQSYSVPAVLGRGGAWTAGSSFIDFVPPVQGQVQAIEGGPQAEYGWTCLSVAGNVPGR